MLIESAADKPAPSVATGDRSRLLSRSLPPSNFRFCAVLPLDRLGNPVQRISLHRPIVTFGAHPGKKIIVCAPQHIADLLDWSSLDVGETGAAPSRRVPVRET